MKNPAVDASQLYPLKFTPLYMERIWGGTLMSEHLDRMLPEHRDPIGEAWELVDRDDAASIVSEGVMQNWSLHELLKHYGAALAGSAAGKYERFPILVKLIDAGEKLSLQVHPDEKACAEIGNGAVGSFHGVQKTPIALNAVKNIPLLLTNGLDPQTFCIVKNLPGAPDTPDKKVLFVGKDGIRVPEIKDDGVMKIRTA